MMLRFSPKTIIGRSSMNLEVRLLGLPVADDVQQRRLAGHRDRVASPRRAEA